MKRVADQLGGGGGADGARRMWHPAKAPEQSDTDTDAPARHGLCHAHGCPLPGSLSTGGDRRYCALHFGAGLEANDRITHWLRTHPLAVEALWVTEATSSLAMQNMAERMERAGLHELVPRAVEIKHDGYGRHGEGLTVERSEFLHPKLYAQRVRRWVAAQIG